MNEVCRSDTIGSTTKLKSGLPRQSGVPGAASTALKDLIGFADGGHPAQTNPPRRHGVHLGFSSSHFFLRFLQLRLSFALLLTEFS